MIDQFLKVLFVIIASSCILSTCSMSARHQCEASTWIHHAHFATVVRGCCRGSRCRFRRPWSCRCWHGRLPVLVFVLAAVAAVVDPRVKGLRMSADRMPDYTHKLQATVSAVVESWQTGYNSLIVQHVRFFLGPTDVQPVAFCLIYTALSGLAISAPPPLRDNSPQYTATKTWSKPNSHWNISCRLVYVRDRVIAVESIYWKHQTPVTDSCRMQSSVNAITTAFKPHRRCTAALGLDRGFGGAACGNRIAQRTPGKSDHIRHTNHLHLWRGHRTGLPTCTTTTWCQADWLGFNGTVSTNRLYRAFEKYAALKKWN